MFNLVVAILFTFGAIYLAIREYKSVGAHGWFWLYVVMAVVNGYTILPFIAVLL